ncbi:D-aminoacyl-tRNA deacylase [hydrothermal vent metagenome]|uniref:D-aminoacyl-tRNA deacylase n=1 Tax=hydrothermal vent metagenome TaxID=652676 RepID=A0A3B1D383_9ZZZZ
MKIIIQRVKKAEVRVKGKVVGRIGIGLSVLLGVCKEDKQKDVDYLVNKIINLRIFEDENGRMNCSAIEVGAEFLIVSQFTLYGSCEKGRRPSFDKAAVPQKAKELYEYFVTQLKVKEFKVETGQFQAMMDVDLVNSGPVTFILETRKKL